MSTSSAKPVGQVKQDQPEQSGKQVALGILGFMIGLMLLLYALNLWLF